MATCLKSNCFIKDKSGGLGYAPSSHIDNRLVLLSCIPRDKKSREFQVRAALVG